jgi:hypothetical protein
MVHTLSTDLQLSILRDVLGDVRIPCRCVSGDGFSSLDRMLTGRCYTHRYQTYASSALAGQSMCSEYLVVLSHKNSTEARKEICVPLYSLYSQSRSGRSFLPGSIRRKLRT